MSEPKTQPTRDGNTVNGDPIRQHQIDGMDHEAHDRYDVSRSWTSHARLAGKIGDTWEEFGQNQAADMARHDEANDLAIAVSEEERVYELLILMRVLRDAQTTAGVTKLNNAAPQVRTSLSMMNLAVRKAVAENNDTRQRLERLYQQLLEQLSRAVESRETAVALLGDLELYLKGIQLLARTNVSVREAWLKEADVLAGVL